MLTVLTALIVVVSACGSAEPNSAATSASTTTAAETIVEGTERAAFDRDPISVPMALYVVTETGDPSSPLSSQRTEQDLAGIAEQMSEIWSQADIDLEVVNIETIEAPSDVLDAIAFGRDTDPFFNQVGATFDVPNPGLINGFYVRSAGGVNGFAPLGSRVFFVVDEPSVLDQRVSSHEVGHIFALHHQVLDPNTLMFSGTNGLRLEPIEQEVARYAAQGVLDGQR